MELSIIIVSYNTKELLAETIASIRLKPTWELLVIDNASSDGSPDMVRRKFPGVVLVENRQNLGFAKANNKGIGAAKGEFVMLLNSDTKVCDDAIGSLLEFMKSSPKVGIASCQLNNPDGSIQPQGGFLPRLSNIAFWMLFIDDIPWLGKYLWPYHVNDSKAYLNEHRTGWVGGTAMMIRKGVIDKIGLLDEEIFMYGEDVEYCIRARRAGFEVAITPKGKIIHYGQKSSGGAQKPAWLGEFKAVKYVFAKHKPKWESPVLRVLLKTGALLRMLVFGILQGRKDAYAAYKEAFWMA
ncbi:MAG: hypothetical protein A2900_03610 [Candidatus Chisholmbacteria bacterium RIFCSPLOWO2_01_FULL_50_28]|uniref:Glycosyltransferase 2-like domain-containing protein n=1 Tax=Candidatus Chisholmbacteria bacterium RIFCSPHIGHO2_01_FULL_52_32 TaxID=1797591 RepID=A0A1G1VST9_9BACT|nr:MAG: hypothetical protein A2786_03130 [Candidatus Chisholmbacteria bacterium RIFCSPHIGHO2_01_FULL_52_32]OGY20162.1 MAG: hypothetical protein A2900_03610 [Candidatus Chisholmbacteria bacterium RIFCSPLOWO2_01_FULL_50_28]